MVYIDYCKAYDSVPHHWTIDVMKAYKISSVIIQFLAAAMKMWKTDLFLYHEGGCIVVKEIQFKRGIYQGDSLSPLLFIISINPISLLLNRRCRGYQLEGMNVTHILYMDDLKGYCNNFQKFTENVRYLGKSFHVFFVFFAILCKGRVQKKHKKN